MRRESPEDRFWPKVKMTSGCWEWQAGTADGYGMFSVHGVLGRAHRFAWECFNGPIPQGMQVLHHCDNRRCVRPLHLFLGTIQDNMRDRDEKQRNARGSQSGRTSLTDEQVLAIRALNPSGRRARWGEARAVAQHWNIDRQTLTDIWHRHTWRHL